MTDPVADSPRVSRDPPALVFVNTAAGGRHGCVCALRIQNLFRELRFPAEFLVTKNSEELQSNVRQAIANKCKLLLAMGGDGTFQGLANAAFGEDVVLGILPAGGGNDFAAALGLPGDPVIAARAVAGGQPRWVDLVRVNTADGRSRLYVGGGGVGLDAEAARYASGAFRRLPGRSRYIASALRALAGYVPIEVRIEFMEPDLGPIEAKALLAGVLNAPTYGAGLRFAPEAQIDDGLLDVVLIEDLSTFEVLALLPRLIFSGEPRTSRVRRWRARRVRLRTRKPTLFHGDGEILGTTPVEIEVVSRAVQVLAPART
ncbi:MAG: hypothetical protein DMG43_07265 [Acidobacteria bacterium]|nr:MAG: hypothetical protein DMG43_07265 [Acidobacteriota bacterium]